MRIIVLLVTLLALAGCVTVPYQNPASVFNNPLGTGESTEAGAACAKAFENAESRALTTDDVHLYGLWRSFSGTCSVYNIAPLKRNEPYLGPVDHVKQILDRAKQKREIADYETVEGERPYAALLF